MKRTQIYLDEGQAAELDQRAAAADTTRSQLIRNAVDAYLERSNGDGDAARLARFKRAVQEAAGAAPHLPPGAEYVEQLRLAGRQRQEELDRHWHR